MSAPNHALLSEHSRLAPRLYAAVNARFLEDAEALFAPWAAIWDIPSGRIFSGRVGVSRFFASWLDSFNDARLDVLELRASARGATVEVLFTGSHTGPLDTMAGRVAATGSRVELRFCDVLDIEDGAIVSLRSYYDAATLLTQLGLARGLEQVAARA